MKLIAITLLLPSADDVPSHVVDWMAVNLANHAAHEFGCDYEPEFGKGYAGPPLIDDPKTVVHEPSELREGQVITDDGDGHFTLFRDDVPSRDELLPPRDDEAS